MQTLLMGYPIRLTYFHPQRYWAMHLLIGGGFSYKKD